MAKTKRIVDRKFKRNTKPRINKTTEYLINSKYIGDEPNFVNAEGRVLTDSELGQAYNWYGYMCKLSDARDYIVDYMESIGKNNIANRVKNIPDGLVPVTAGWICRIITRGSRVPDRSKEFLVSRIMRALERSESSVSSEIKVQKKQVQTRVIDIQLNIREKARNIIGDIEHMIDSGSQFSVYEFLKQSEIPPTYSAFIADFYSKMVNELTEVLKGTDADLKYGYRNHSKAEIKRMLDFYTLIVNEATQYGDNAKQIRKSNRKPKTVTTEKIIKNFKFKKNDQELKLVSIEPQQILAAQELWTFNTKTKILSVYRAKDQGGLGIKTVNITGFDETTSISKRLRKPEQTLAKIMTGGKSTLKNIMNELTTTAIACKPRISSDTILLKTTKL